MPTFYALLSTTSPAAATPLTAGEAAALKGALYLDVASWVWADLGDPLSTDASLSGPKLPGTGLFEVYMGEREREFPFRETLSVFGYKYNVPADEIADGLVLEYEAPAELLLSVTDFFGRPSVWLFVAGDDLTLGFAAAEGYEIGGTTFRVYGTGGTPPATPPFWTDLRGSVENA